MFLRKLGVFLLAQLVIASIPDHHDSYKRNGRNTFLADQNEVTSDYWKNQGQNLLRSKVEKPLNTNRAKNIIFFIGDGMSVATLATARAYLGQLNGMPGEETQLSFETFPHTGLVKTYCVNDQVADSACTATAYFSGIKTNRGILGLNAGNERGDCPSQPENEVDPITQWAIEAGKDAGIVTNTRITHASPGGGYARISQRNWENDALVNGDGFSTEVCPDIAHQLIHTNPGRNLKVILGGGRYSFRNSTVVDEEGVVGHRLDGRDLIAEWQAEKNSRGASHSYVWNRSQLMDLDTANTDYLLGLFKPDHMSYNTDRDPTVEPSLAELTEVAIRMLQKNENGFFLFVEGGRIDHAHHSNWARRAFDETVELHKAVEVAMSMTDESDTLIVVSSDHSHVMSINGYPPRGNDILGPTGNLGLDGVPYMTVNYGNGPGFRAHASTGVRQDVTLEDMTSPTFMHPAETPLASETHAGDDVAVFARGPYDHIFTGLYEQSALPHFMAYAACIGPGLHACSSAFTVTAPALLVLLLSFFNLLS